MYRSFPWFVLLVIGCLVIGCGQKSPPAVVPGPVDPGAEPANRPGPGDGGAKKPDPAGTGEVDAARREKYDKAMRIALNLLADRKHSEALDQLELAQGIEDTEEVRREIERVKALLTQGKALEQTVQDIRGVLKDGNADEASRLAGSALQQFGGGDDAARLAQLKLQADILAASNLQDQKARIARFQGEGEAALRETPPNLRAAVLAFDQAVEAGAGPEVRKQLEEIRDRLARYDEKRQQASQLRRDPAGYEDALVALEDAQKAWDTLQVRQELDDYRLALLKRRDRISVADFEVRGDVAIPLAGRTIAEELLPAFKTRYDVVERAQFAKIVAELKLEPADLVEDADGQREVGKLARIRYLVLGSVSSLGGVTINARMVDVRTGLIVQTGKVAGQTPEAALKRLPLLSQMLLSSDDERIALETQLAKELVVEVAPAAAAPIPPPPPVPAAEKAPPQPVFLFNPQPPDFGGAKVQDFDQLPPPPPPDQAVAPPVVVIPQEDPFRNRLLHVNLMLGDNLFLRGRFRDALRHFELCLNLFPGEVDISIRLDRCRAMLPPVVLVPEPVIVYRPRIVVMPFLVHADPRWLPIGYGDWMADYFASQLYPWYDVVDRGELYWWMARLGLRVRDVIHNPWARFWLARAMGIRYFVFGYIQETASYNVVVHMVDAETGFRIGMGRIHVHDRYELKLRAGDLVRQIRMDPHQRDRWLRDAAGHERLLADLRRLLREGRVSQALDLGRPALRTHPYDTALRTLVEQAERRAEELALLDARRRAAEERQAQLLALQRQQADLARLAELARLKAEQDAKARDDAARRAHDLQQQRAYDQLVSQANAALKAQDFLKAIQLWQSALALKPTDDGYKHLADARRLQEELAQKKAAEEEKRREDAKRKQMEADLAKLKLQLEQEKKAREAEELARRKAQEASDLAAYQKFIDDAQAQIKKGNFEAAIALLLSARQLRSTPEVQKLLASAQDLKAKAELDKKTAAEKAERDKKLADEQKARAEAEALAKKNQQLYSQALAAGQKALADKRYDEALARFREAGKLFSTAAVTSGIRQAEEALAAERVRAEADKKKMAEDAARAARVKQLLSDGQAALDAKQYDKAVQTLTEAKKLAPTDIAVLTLLGKAEQARDDVAEAARRAKELAERKDKLRKLLEDGKAKLAAKNYDAALKSANDALKLVPGDTEALALVTQIEKARTAAADDAKTKDLLARVKKLLDDGKAKLAAKDYDAALKSANDALKLKPGDSEALALVTQIEKTRTATADAKKKAEEHLKLVTDGKAMLAAQKYDDAIRTIQKALDVMPGDSATLALLKQAEQAKKDQAAQIAKQEEAARQAEVVRLLKLAQSALAAKDLAAAAKSIDAAAKLAPRDPNVLRAQADLQKAQSDAQAAADALKKKMADFQALLTKARLAYQGKRYDDALAALADADRLIPNDKDALDLRRDVEKARADALGDAKKKADFQALVTKAKQSLAAKQYDQALAALADADRLIPGDRDLLALRKQVQSEKAAAEAEAKKKAEEAKRLAEYNKLMAQGQQSMNLKRYDDAVQAFAEALKVMPNDPKARAALADAQKALADSKKPKGPTPQEEYAKYMQAAAAAEKRQQWDDAIRNYQSALKFIPNDAKAMTGMRNAQLEQYLDDGQRALKSKKFADAVRSFEAALKIDPKNKEAQDGLKKAKSGK